MKIKTLSLENFQGVRSARFSFDGQSASIYGDNATGKTTVFNAVTWLLFDKPSTGAKNYTPKTKGANGDLHNLVHRAEAAFIMDDGRIVSLRKDYHEVYKKKRGSATEEFDGHTIDFYIDGVPVKEKEYAATIAAFCGGAEAMKMLTMPDYFAETMPWDQRRKILLDVCGDVSDDDVIAAHKDLEALDAYLLMPGTTRQFYSVEEYKKIANAKRGDINKELQAIPNRIDEAQRAIPEETPDIDFIDARIAALEKDREVLAERRAGLIAGNTACADAQKATAEAEAALAKARAAYFTKTTDEAARFREVERENRNLLDDYKAKAAEARRKAAAERDLIDRTKALRKTLLDQYAAISAETFDEGQETCPTCGQRLPEDRIEQLRSDFNLNRSQRLQDINERGKTQASQAIIAAAEERAEQYAAEAVDAAAKANELAAQIERRRAAFVQVPFEKTEEYARLTEAIAACHDTEDMATDGAVEQVSDLTGKIDALKAEIAGLQAQKQKAVLAEAQRNRIAELEDRERQLGAEYESLEQGIYLCDEFTKAKIRMLTDRIDAKFKSVRFRLFQEQQNGGIKDDCEVLIPDATGRMVPYTFANNAARINAGLEIINALAAHWNLSMPVFIDNAESVTHLARTDMQTIRLVVSEDDKDLRVVPEGGAA